MMQGDPYDLAHRAAMDYGEESGHIVMIRRNFSLRMGLINQLEIRILQSSDHEESLVILFLMAMISRIKVRDKM